MNNKNDVILSIKDLEIVYKTKEIGTARAVNRISLEVRKGETLGLVGETGAGKTTTAYGVLRLVPAPQGHVIGGTVEFEGRNLYDLSEREMRKIRGKKISMIFQDPMTALNPIDPVGKQISEVIYLHNKISRKEADLRAVEMLEMVGIPGERFFEYPHQFSGGMKQRVVIAIALACNPEFLIADEPTTALDVTIQAQVLEMINNLQKEMGTSMLLITHDLGVVAQMCDSVAIMYAGEIIEYGTVRQIYKNKQHPYTIGLFESLPNVDVKMKRLKPIPGLMPDPSNLPTGCYFSERCPYATEECRKNAPPNVQVEPGHFVRCNRMQKG